MNFELNTVFVNAVTVLYNAIAVLYNAITVLGNDATVLSNFFAVFGVAVTESRQLHTYSRQQIQHPHRVTPLIAPAVTPT